MDFSKKGVEKKQKALVSKLPRNKKKLTVSLFKAMLVLFLAIIVLGIGAGFGALKGILDDTPEVNAKDLIPKGYQTTLYDQDGKELKVLASFDANREYVYYDDIPENLVNAFIAIEDQRFWEHNGIDVQGIMRAFAHGLQSGDFDQGASTLTQQLIKNQIFNVGLDEKTMFDKIERKVQEQYLAVEIEKVLPKKSIAEYYLNTIYLGQGRYGVETASQYYFNKQLKDLTISECAVLAAIPQNPSKFDPVVFPEENAKSNAEYGGVPNLKQDLLAPHLDKDFYESPALKKEEELFPISWSIAVSDEQINLMDTYYTELMGNAAE